MLAILNARMETITQGIIENGQLLIEHGKITAIGTHLDIPADARRIDAAGRTVTPGIIEAHSHAGISEQGIGWAGDDTNEVTNPVTPWCRAIDGINMLDTAFAAYREAGITAVNILPGSANLLGGTSVAVKCTGVIVDEAVILNPSGMKAALGENPKKVYGEAKKTPSTRMGNAALLRDALLKAKQYHEKTLAAQSDADQPKYDKEAEALLPVIKGEIPMRIHCHRADDIVTAVRIMKEFGLRYTLEHVTDGHLLIDFLRETGASMAVGPTMHYGSKVENQDRDFRTAVAFSRAGIPFCFCTDHPVIAGQYLILSAGLAVGWGMEREAAMRSITLGAAEHIGIGDRVGSIEPGKDADLVIWSGDPLEFTSFADMTIINGEIVFTREVA